MRVLLLLTSILYISSNAAVAADRPNILFLFADDWGKYAGVYQSIDGVGGINDVVQTPHIDKVASEGVTFTNAFVNAPSCTPCRSSLLSGQYFFRTGRAAILQGAVWDSSIPTYPLLLKNNGYHIGYTYKVWGPGTPSHAGYGGKPNGYHKSGGQFNGFSQRATAMVENGSKVAEAKQKLLDEVAGNFNNFLDSGEKDAPFCYWFGPTNVHRKWIAGSGKELWKIDPDDLKGKMPEFLPDVPVVRQDLADYLGEIAAFDAAVGRLLHELEVRGEADNTLVVISGDHGAPGFPRGKCNLYDFGTSVALIAKWPGKIPENRVVTDFTTLMDLAPTFLEVGGVEIPEVMTGRSLIPTLTSEKSGQVDPTRDHAITGRERHVAIAREGNLPYPQRAIRTKDFLYIINFAPDRSPMGDPGQVTDDFTPSTDALTNETFVAFGDLDASPTKAWMVNHRFYPEWKKHYDLGFAKRPHEELYVVAEDPDQIHNVADKPEYASTIKQLRDQLLKELKEANDPRLLDNVPYEYPPFAGQ